MMMSGRMKCAAEGAVRAGVHGCWVKKTQWSMLGLGFPSLSQQYSIKKMIKQFSFF
jgi:hypothetical protein